MALMTVAMNYSEVRIRIAVLRAILVRLRVVGFGSGTESLQEPRPGHSVLSLEGRTSLERLEYLRLAKWEPKDLF